MAKNIDLDKFEKFWKDELVEYIEDNYPKGDKDREKMSMELNLFMFQLMKNVSTNDGEGEYTVSDETKSALMSIANVKKGNIIKIVQLGETQIWQLKDIEKQNPPWSSGIISGGTV